MRALHDDELWVDEPAPQGKNGHGSPERVHGDQMVLEGEQKGEPGSSDPGL